VIERFKDAALHSLGRAYGHSGPATTNCVRFLYDLLSIVYGDIIKSMSDELHLNLPDGLGSFANCEALVGSGIGEWALTPSAPGVYYCQGWRKTARGEWRGHAFALICYPVPLAGTLLWILESTNRDADTDNDGIPDRFDWYRPVNWASIVDRWTEGVRLVRLLEP
jgi:hypothetical protein